MPQALKRFSTSEIGHLLDTGEIPDKLTEILEAALKTAKEAGESAVQFFVEDNSDDEEDE